MATSKKRARGKNPPRMTLHTKVSSEGLLGLWPGPRGDVIVAAFNFEPHHAGGDVVRFRQDGRTWRRKRLRSRDDYHGEALALAFAEGGNAFAYVYWDDDRIGVELWDVRGARPRFDTSLPLPPGRDTPRWAEHAAIAVDPGGERAVVSVMLSPEEEEEEDERTALLFSVTRDGAVALPLEAGFTASGVAFVGTAILLSGDDGTLIARERDGAREVGRTRAAALSAAGDRAVMAVRGGDVLLAKGSTLARVRLEPAPAVVETWTAPFEIQDARLGSGGVVAVRSRSKILDRWEPGAPLMTRNMPAEVKRVALGGDASILFEGDAAKIRIWPKDRWLRLPAVRPDAAIVSMVASNASVAEILDELGPASSRERLSMLDRILAVAGAKKSYWPYLNMARDVAEQRAEIALAEGRLADAYGDLGFSVAMKLDDKDANERSAVAKRAEALRARIREERPDAVWDPDLPTQHLLALLQRAPDLQRKSLVRSLAASFLEAELTYSGAFHLLYGIVEALTYLFDLSFVPQDDAGKGRAGLEATRALAEAHLQIACQRLPGSALPWWWTARIADPARAKACRDEAATRLAGPGGLEPALVTAFLDRQAANAYATWNRETNNWRVGFPKPRDESSKSPPRR